MISIGTKVRIRVNYLSELDPDIEPVWESIVTDIDSNDDQCYYIEEIDMWFSKSELEVIDNIENVIDKLLDRLQNHFCYTSNIFEDTILNNKIRITNEFNYRYSDNVKEYRKQLCALILTTFQNNGIITSEESSYWYDTRDEALDALVQMVLDRSHLTY